MKWYELDPDRFQVEMALIAQYHPGTRIIKEKGVIRAEKQYSTPRANYLIKAIFSDNHPYKDMQVFIENPPIKKNPHVFSKGRLCLYHCGEVGVQTTAKVYLDWTIQWIKCYEKWLDTGEWPVTNKGLRI